MTNGYHPPRPEYWIILGDSGTFLFPWQSAVTLQSFVWNGSHQMYRECFMVKCTMLDRLSADSNLMPVGGLGGGNSVICMHGGWGRGGWGDQHQLLIWNPGASDAWTLSCIFSWMSAFSWIFMDNNFHWEKHSKRIKRHIWTWIFGGACLCPIIGIRNTWIPYYAFSNVRIRTICIPNMLEYIEYVF